MNKKHFFSKSNLKRAFNRDKQLYFLCIPALIYIFIFCYGPMYGLQLAFKDYSAAKGIWGSEWVGLKHFQRFIASPQFWTLIKNTLVLSFYHLLAGFPLPILLAILLHQCTNKKFRGFVQTVIYAPHFISTVVMCGMLLVFFAFNTGIVNTFLSMMGFEKKFFMASPSFFPHLYVWSGVWQGAGWGTIIYIAALGSISNDQYEAARMDGANKRQLIWYIDLPNILPTVVTMLILDMGKVMSIGFQKVYLLQNPMNLQASEIISTYVYKIGLIQSRFDYATSIDLFNNLINILLLVCANKISKKLAETSLW